MADSGDEKNAIEVPGLAPSGAPSGQSHGASATERFDYAWKWFSYHADQRVKMFNYMLVVVSIFATAVTTASDKGMHGLAIAMCGIAAALALIFSRLDRRNQDLVRLGEDVLADLEMNWFFKFDDPTQAPDYKRRTGIERTEVEGLLVRERSRRPADWHPLCDTWNGVNQFASKKPAGMWDAFRTTAKEYSHAACVGKHRFWLRTTAYLIALLFVFAGCVIASRPNETGVEKTPRDGKLIGKFVQTSDGIPEMPAGK